MGLILFNKRCGITSFDSLKEIKKELKTGKVGHTGTLDKFASGLLIVLTGKDLKLSKYFTGCDKQYVAKIRFGIETDTLDPEGKIVKEGRIPGFEEVFRAIWKHLGAIWQEPPVFSALHINGKRASSLAREGFYPVMKKRSVTIYKLEFLSWQPPFAEIFVHCSSGTYIRSLARDIALAADSCAHLCELARTKIAGFYLGIRNEEWEMRDVGRNEISLLGLPILDISEDQAQYIKHGRPLSYFFLNNNLNLPLCVSRTFGSTSLRENINTLALFYGEELAAVIEKKDGKWKYGCVFP